MLQFQDTMTSEILQNMLVFWLRSSVKSPKGLHGEITSLRYGIIIQSLSEVEGPSVAELHCPQNCQMGDAGFNLRSSLSTQSFGVFSRFFRNSRKCGLGFLRKTLVEGTPHVGPGPTCGQLALIPQPNPTRRSKLYRLGYFRLEFGNCFPIESTILR